MTAIIIEDEVPSARRLERMLSIYEIELISVLSSVKQTIHWFHKNQQPDLIFLDIHLADGLCFEIFNHVKVDSKIIFTTAYSDYSIRAFEYNSFSYLLKPIKENQLTQAIDKAKAFVKTEKDLEMLKQVISSHETEIYKDTFAVKIGSKIKIIKELEIACFYSSDNATYIRTEEFNGVINHSLNSLEQEINPKLFFRVNRTFIIKRSAIKSILAFKNSRLKITLTSYNESEIIVSRERVKQFKKWIESSS
ncbi:MAG: response regulator transcription factor [Flavobacteriaceae bacterium]